MKILILNWRDITHRWAGGAEVHMHELAKQWVKLGHQVTLLTGGYRDAPGYEVIDGIRIIRIGTTYSSYIFIPLYYIFRLRNAGIDVIVDVAHGTPYFIKLFTRKNVVLIIHHNHEKLWEEEFGPVMSRAGKFIEKRVVPLIYRNCLTFVFSEFEKNRLLSESFRNVVAVPPGIDSSKYFTEKGIKKSREPLLLYMGRIRKYKRVKLLIDIFPRILKKFPKTKLVIAGDGEYKNHLVSLVRKKNLSGKIIFPGYISDESSKRLWYNRAWLNLFPSMMEGWGFVVFEAGLCGTPTVGFNVPGLMDSVVHYQSGYLAETITEYSDAIIRFLKNSSERKRLSRGAREYAAKFTWQKCAKIFEKNIKQYLSKP